MDRFPEFDPISGTWECSTFRCTKRIAWRSFVCENKRGCWASYCEVCLAALFAKSLESRRHCPAKCVCNSTIDLDQARRAAHQVLVPYAKEKLYEEWSATNPLCCANPGCAAFIMDLGSESDPNTLQLVLCDRCQEETCSNCRGLETPTAEHGEDCEPWEEQPLDPELGAWVHEHKDNVRCCPGCRNVTERKGKGLCMQCPVCKDDWCWNCGEFLRSCLGGAPCLLG